LPNFQAKRSQSQAKVLTGGGNLREAQVDVPLSVSHTCVWSHSWTLWQTSLTITGEYAYANSMESGWGPWLFKQKTSSYEDCNYLGESSYFGWLAVWGWNPDWRSEWKFRRLGEASTPVGGNAGRVPSLHRIMPWHLPYNWGKSR